MSKVTTLFGVLLLATIAHAEADEKVLRADFRHRPFEMVIENEKRSGPLKDIIEEAAKKIGYKVKWRNSHFARSLNELENGGIDILPRTMRTKEREAFVNYLGPIGYQEKNILFLVKKDQEDMINSYNDLKGLSIEVKKKTAYFKRFDEDTTLNKRENWDDDNMVRMFDLGRFDTMPVLDKDSLENAMKKYNITNYSYANYQYIQKIGNYYGMSKKSENSNLYDDLNKILKYMAKIGRVAEIYKKFGLKPPLQN